MNEKHCFIISPIGDDDSDIRRRSDQIFNHVITPVVREFNYEPVRSDILDDPGVITNQVIARLLEDDLVIADLTGRNPNVYYELAIRHAFHKAVIQLIDSTETLPFDVSMLRTIKIDHRDLDSVENCKSEIRGQIESIEQSARWDNPITQTVDLQELRQTDSQASEYLAILSALKDLQHQARTHSRRLAELDRSFPLFGDEKEMIREDILESMRILRNIFDHIDVLSIESITDRHIQDSLRGNMVRLSGILRNVHTNLAAEPGRRFDIKDNLIILDNKPQ